MYWQEEYFDPDYEEKQKLLRQVAKEDYEEQQRKILKELERYEEYRKNAEPGEYYPDCAA